MISESDKKNLATAMADIETAATFLDKAAKGIAKFGENVPALPLNVIEGFAKNIRSIDFSVKGIKSFLSVSFLQQFAQSESKETT